MKKRLIAAAAASLFAAVAFVGTGPSTTLAGSELGSASNARGNDWEARFDSNARGNDWEARFDSNARGNDWEFGSSASSRGNDWE